MIVDPIFIFPDAQEPDNAEYGVFAIAFEKEDWDDMGIDKDALEYNPLYLGKNEFVVFRAKLNDPLYLNEFYENNADLLKTQYWRTVSRDRFVIDTTASWPDYYGDFTKACREYRVYDLFDPLGKGDAAIRAQNEKRKRPHQLLRLKSKFGFILDRIPFRLYAIEVDFDCFIITGGAIKIVEEMKQAPNTKLELKKLNTVMSELKSAGITNKKSLLDCIYERSSQADIDS